MDGIIAVPKNIDRLNHILDDILLYPTPYKKKTSTS